MPRNRTEGGFSQAGIAGSFAMNELIMEDESEEVGIAANKHVL